MSFVFKIQLTFFKLKKFRLSLFILKKVKIKFRDKNEQTRNFYFVIILLLFFAKGNVKWQGIIFFKQNNDKCKN